MENPILELKNVNVEPDSVPLYLPPIVWKGDSIGHIGTFDVFFLVLEGECFLRIDKEHFIVRKGQLAFLPKGKMRQYTQISENFSMYEVRFDASANGENLMQLLGLSDGDYVVDLHGQNKVQEIFESSSREELFKSPVYFLDLCSNVINIICIYTEERRLQSGSDTRFFKPVLEYMSENLEKNLTLSELSALVFMHPTYFVRRFGKCFGISPLAYFNRMKIYHTMGLLTSTQSSVEEISKAVGFSDSSYFARVFKKYTSTTPTEYRAAFKR